AFPCLLGSDYGCSSRYGDGLGQLATTGRHSRQNEAVADCQGIAGRNGQGVGSARSLPSRLSRSPSRPPTLLPDALAVRSSRSPADTTPLDCAGLRPGSDGPAAVRLSTCGSSSQGPTSQTALFILLLLVRCCSLPGRHTRISCQPWTMVLCCKGP